MTKHVRNHDLKLIKTDRIDPEKEEEKLLTRIKVIQELIDEGIISIRQGMKIRKKLFK